jgi:hypothetical protein
MSLRKEMVIPALHEPEWEKMRQEQDMAALKRDQEREREEGGRRRSVREEQRRKMWKWTRIKTKQSMLL